MTIMNTQPTSQQYIYYVPLKKTLPNPDICLFCLIRLFSAGETSAQMKKVYDNWIVYTFIFLEIRIV